jgi:regulator of protease activity HflC (stomatin/prohibitin superfamily)
MEEEDSLLKSAKFWRAFIKIVLWLTFLVAFWPEIEISLKFLWLMLGSIFNRFPWFIYDPTLRQMIADEISKALTPEVVSALSILLFIALLYLGLFLVSIFMVAQFVLPIHDGQDRWPAFTRLLRYWFQGLLFNLFKLHGAALFIKEGKRIEQPGESESLEPGVVLVDLNSAIIIERQHNFLTKESDNYVEEIEPDIKEPGTKSRVKKKRKAISGVRAAGPGLVFTNYGERIAGEVDLRKQFRILPGVQAYTRDGIKVTTAIITVFALGEKEDTVYVTYVGGAKNAENLRFIQLDSDNKTIKGFYKLDPDEREEIQGARQNLQSKPGSSPAGATSPNQTFIPPYHYDPERVSAAVYAKFYNVEDKDIKHWTDLPPRVATEIVRNSVARVTYDDLYSPKNRSNNPLREFKATLARTIRHQGVMSYQFVEHKTGQFLEAGTAWDETMLNMEPARPLPGSRLLRDYGIKIIHATFSELKPDQQIRKKLMETWMARWEKEIETIKAENELKAVRIRNNARAQAQLDMASSLSSLFKTAADSPQAMALRVFQALETAATDPSTSQVLPRNVFNMLQSLHSWLLKERKNKDEHHPPHNETNQKTDEKPDAS